MDPQELERIAARRYDEFLEDLRSMVNVDCGSYTPEGVNDIADLCQARFEAGGWKVERIPHVPAGGEPQLGDLVIGRLDGGGGPRVLMIGHTDTVFEPGTAAARPFRIEGDRATGPGVSDMKGGLLTGFFAVEVLREAGFDGFGSITYICNPDEEIGSPFSRPHIRQAATNADVAFVLEGARENGDVVSARKGVSDFRIEILGRAAHAGVEPERGRSAILEAAHKVIALHELNGRWPGVTVNAELTSRQLRKFCATLPAAEKLLAAAISQLGLSARGRDRALRVARTIADLASSQTITAEHCAEAIQYRGLDRQWWA